MGILCFRYVDDRGAVADTNLLQQRIVDRLVAEGFAMMTTTVIRGETVLRMCTINPRTSRDDIVQTLDGIEEIGRDLSGSV